MGLGPLRVRVVVMRTASKKKDVAHPILAAGSPEWFFFNKTHIPGVGSRLNRLPTPFLLLKMATVEGLDAERSKKMKAKNRASFNSIK